MTWFSASCPDSTRAGEWLLDPRLLNKRLDIRIQGTKATLWHNGRYENEGGFVVLTKPPSNVDVSVSVKLGFAQSRLFFPLRFLHPEVTTERSGFVLPEARRPVISTVGQRVVIIGADLEGKADLIGNYALIIHYPQLAPGHTCVQIMIQGPLWGRYGFFDEKSLCRSHFEPIEWMGKTIE